jgi:hypothetical protein
MGRDQVFAGLEIVLLAAEPDAADEDPFARYGAGTLEEFGDGREIGAALDGHAARLVKRPFALELKLAKEDAAAGSDDPDHDDGQQEVQENDEWMANGARALRRRWNGFRLKRLGRAFRADPMGGKARRQEVGFVVVAARSVIAHHAGLWPISAGVPSAEAVGRATLSPNMAKAG